MARAEKERESEGEERRGGGEVSSVMRSPHPSRVGEPCAVLHFT